LIDEPVKEFDSRPVRHNIGVAQQRLVWMLR
jgi:hypothetical protein